MSLASIDSKTWRASLLGGEVEVGDITSATFKPHIKLKRWGDECSINFAFPTTRTNNATIVDGQLIWNGGANYEARFYELAPGTNGHNELGGFEFELVLKKKPPTNSFTFTVDTVNLNWYYQPPLTPEEIAESAIRPDDVVGSYAVYHATRTTMHPNTADADKYKAGKAFHLYRPKVTDNAGKTIWATLKLVGSQMTITVDRTWLNSAAYPVVIDPDFGVTGIGGSSAAFGSTYWRGEKASAPATGGVDSISIYCTITPTGFYKGVLCSTALEIVANGVGAAIETAAGWRTSTYSTKPSISSGTAYWIGAIYSDADGGSLAYDTVTADGTHARDTTNSYDTPTNPTDADVNRVTRHSIYCTYTADEPPASGGGTLPRNRAVIIAV